MSTDHDVLHGLDGSDNIHSGICAITVCPGMGRVDVRYSMGCFSGKALIRGGVMKQDTTTDGNYV